MKIKDKRKIVLAHRTAYIHIEDFLINLDPTGKLLAIYEASMYAVQDTRLDNHMILLINLAYEIIIKNGDTTGKS